MTTITRRTGRPADDAVARRAEIFRRARPLLEEFGYREVTVKQLARACHMSPAALYHWFPTKRDLVLYQLSPPDRSGGNARIVDVLRMIVIAFVGNKEKRSIMAVVAREYHRSAQPSAELVEDSPGSLRCEEVAGVQTSGVVLVKPASM